MGILGAYLLPHPPLAVRDVGKGQEGAIKATLAALDEAAEQIAALSPAAVVFITPHGTVYSDYFHISPGRRASGDLSKFGAPAARFEAEYSTELADAISLCAEKRGLHAGTLGERDARLDHGVTVPMSFINRMYERYKAVRISASGMGREEHYMLGQTVAEAAAETGRGTVVIASGDLSHKLTADGPYSFAPEGRQFDEAITAALAEADFSALFGIPESLREAAAECGFGPIMALAGCFDGLSVKSRLMSYEGPFGVGYAVAEFLPGAAVSGRNFLERHKKISQDAAREIQMKEDAYQKLARRSLEYTLTKGGALPLPEGLPAQMTSARAGVFVSFHKNGRLRGCVGTIMPTTDSAALEIIQNAVSAGTRDNRFEPVTADELAYLTCKVDVLKPPEVIKGPGELDVKRYGVIVSAGSKRGLLLPNLEGIDTAERQIAIAKQKAGIAQGEAIKLERFEVIRHE